MDADDQSLDPSRPISRRTLITAGAWTVPAVVVAVAAPAASASTIDGYVGGTLSWNGFSYDTGIALNPDLNTSGATGTYAVGAIQIIVAAPAGSTITSTTVGPAQPGWTTTMSADSTTVTFSLAAAVPPNSYLDPAAITVRVTAGLPTAIALPTGLAVPFT